MTRTDSGIHAAMRRMGKGEGCWAAEIAVRGVGLLLLSLCASSAWWLYRSLNTSAPHAAYLIDYLVAALAVLGWWFGWAFLVEGPGLFKLIPIPGRGWMEQGDMT